MWLWDGTDRQEDDVEAAVVDAVRRAMISADPTITASMRAYVAGFSIALTGTKSGDLVAPAPIIQGGFTPSDDERRLMCEVARREGRDLVHLCFRTFAPFTPTGLVVVAYIDGDLVRLHSRSAPVWDEKNARVRLDAVEDEPDINFRLAFGRNDKLKRKKGALADFDPSAMMRAAGRIEELIKDGEIGDVSDEPLAFYHGVGLELKRQTQILPNHPRGMR